MSEGHQGVGQQIVIGVVILVIGSILAAAIIGEGSFAPGILGRHFSGPEGDGDVSDSRQDSEGRPSPVDSASETRIDVSWMDSDLIAHYPFDGTSQDATGSGHDADSRSVTATYDRFRRSNHAYSFDGAPSSVSVPRSSNPLSEEFTLSVWAKHEDTGRPQSIAEAWNSGEGSGVNIFYHPRDDRYYFQMRIGSSNYQLTCPALPLGDWRHLVHVYDGETQIAYLDGLPVGRNRIGKPFKPPRAMFYIGDEATYGDRHFDGSLDDVRVYGRALNAQEVSALAMEGL